MKGLVTCDRLCAYLLANFCLIYHRICLSSIGTRTKLIQSTRVSVYKQYEMYKCINLKHFAQIGRFLVWSFRKFAQRKWSQDHSLAKQFVAHKVHDIWTSLFLGGHAGVSNHQQATLRIAEIKPGCLMYVWCYTVESMFIPNPWSFWFQSTSIWDDGPVMWDTPPQVTLEERSRFMVFQSPCCQRQYIIEFCWY